MARAIQICLTAKPNPDLVHRLRNLGEDLYRSLRDSYDVSLEEIDSATTSFTVRGIKPKQARRITALIEEHLEKHALMDSAELIQE